MVGNETFSSAPLGYLWSDTLNLRMLQWGFQMWTSPSSGGGSTTTFYWFGGKEAELSERD